MRKTLIKTEEFRDSPVGRIPKDWDVKPLSELADVDRGKFTHRPRNDPRFYGGSYPFIQTGDIANSSGGVLSTYSQTLNERGITVSREFPIGTIAITIAANIADTAILGIPMFFPDSVVGAVVKKPNSIRYVELCIRRAKQRLDTRAQQSAQKNINLEDLRPLLIPVPSPEEQHKIAKVIDTIEAVIACTESLIAKLKLMKAGLLHDLLTRGLGENGELRDAIAHPEQFEDSPVGRIPREEWEVLKLNSLLKGRPKNGYSPKEVNEWSGTLMLGLSCLTEEGFEPLQLKNAPSNDLKIRSALLCDGDFLLSRSNTRERVALAGVYRDLGVPCIYPDLMMRLSLKEKTSSRFVELLLRHFPVRKQLINNAQGTSESMVKITSKTVIETVVALPNTVEQAQIIECIDTYNTRIQTEEAYRDKLKLQKKGLMHDLLTGRVRVKRGAT